jgi:DNA topoisomerase-1
MAKLPKISILKEAEDFLNNNRLTYKVADLETKPTKITNRTFTTSTLQKQPENCIYLLELQCISATFVLAGLITYMRTDSVNLSKDAGSCSGRNY